MNMYNMLWCTMRWIRPLSDSIHTTSLLIQIKELWGLLGNIWHQKRWWWGGWWCGCHFQQRGFIWRPSSLITLAAPLCACVCSCSSSLDAITHSSLMMQMVDPGQASDSSWSLWWWTLKGSLFLRSSSRLHSDQLLGQSEGEKRWSLGCLSLLALNLSNHNRVGRKQISGLRGHRQNCKSYGSLFFFEATNFLFLLTLKSLDIQVIEEFTITSTPYFCNFSNISTDFNKNLLRQWNDARSGATRATGIQEFQSNGALGPWFWQADG